MERETTTFETARLAMRPWRDGDAEALYRHAKNPAVGPIAGWPVHTSVENSREVIRDILSARGTWAITEKRAAEPVGESPGEPIGSIGLMTGTASNLTLPTGSAEIGYRIGEPIGSIGLMTGTASNLVLPPTEGEIGYWIAEQFWGRGYATEATRELVRRAFTEMGMRTLWCGWFDGNDRSRRVGEKCEFRHVRTEKRYWPAIDRTVVQRISRLTGEEWGNGPDAHATF